MRQSRNLVYGYWVALGIFIVLSLTTCQSPAEKPQWQWQRAEAGLPRQAIVLTLAADPANPDRLWAGYYGTNALATSADGGQTWAVSAVRSEDNPIFDLLALPPQSVESGTVLWAATRDGLFQSFDAGSSWQSPPGDLPQATAFALAADSRGRLYVGLDDNGIYAQSAGESGWISLAKESPLESLAVFSLVVSGDGQQLYAGTPGHGVWASSDGGRAWIATYSGEYVPTLALNPNNPDIAVASLRERLVRTHDGGQSWHTLPLAPSYDEFVSLLWLADGTLGAGTSQGRLYRSQDNGDTWFQGGDGLPPGGVLSLTVAGGGQLGGNQLLVGTWTGVYASNDGGQTLTYLTPSLGTPRPQTLLATSDQLLLGTGTGLFRWQIDTQQWARLSDAFSSGVASLAVSPENDQLIYVGTLNDGVHRSVDGGTNWQRASSFRFGVPALEVDPQNSDHLYLLAAWERVYESLDSGNTWIARWDGLGSVIEATSLAIDPVQRIAYVGTETGLFKSVRGGDWRLTALPLSDQSILALLARPNRNPLAGSVLYIGTTRGVYRSLNNGETIQGGDVGSTEWGRGLENISVTALLPHPQIHQRLYAGTAYAGVYESIDGGQSWHPIDPAELTNEVVESMAWGPNGELFVAATNGARQAISNEQ